MYFNMKFFKGMALCLCPTSCVINIYEDMDIKSNGFIYKDHVVKECALLYHRKVGVFTCLGVLEIL